jgi:hypothetical protein
MPGYDGNGPFGDGRVGRGMGPCGKGQGNFTGLGRFGGFGRRSGGRGARGRGAGFGYFNFAPTANFSKENEVNYLEDLLLRIKERLTSLKNSKE